MDSEMTDHVLILDDDTHSVTWCGLSSLSVVDYTGDPLESNCLGCVTALRAVALLHERRLRKRMVELRDAEGLEPWHGPKR